MAELLESIKEAIKDEQDAQKKYKKLRNSSDDAKTKALYEQLIRDERDHEKILQSRYQALKKKLN